MEERSTPRSPALLAVEDVLVDSMRGRSSTWTRIRINLRHVPEEHAACRRKLPIRMTIPRANGASGGKRKTKERLARLYGSPPCGKIAANSCGGTTSAAHKCNRSASCRCAICGIAPYDGSDRLACGRRQLRPPIQAAAAPRINLCPDSSGFGRRACASPVVISAALPPKPSRDGSRVHLCDTA